MSQQLPLLTFVADELFPDSRLDDVLVIACQHLLGTTINLFDIFIDRGLKPQDLFVIGKCYSSNIEVIDELTEMGIYVSPFSTSFQSHISFDDQFLQYIEVFMQHIQSSVNFKLYKKIIILDDGGHLLLFANDFFKTFDNVVGIEQTSSGYNLISKVALKFPVINVARSNVKLTIESPMIAGLIVKKIEKYFTEEGIVSPNILVIGQGHIGKLILELLKQNGHYVAGHDLIANKTDYHGEWRNKISEFDVIIGATGDTILWPGEFGGLKKGVILISASSSDREFSASYLRTMLSENNNCHTNIVVNEITLLNGGFPVNFIGNRHSLPPEEIQLTRALLLVAVFQALTTQNDYLICDLASLSQQKILKRFQEI